MSLDLLSTLRQLRHDGRAALERNDSAGIQDVIQVALAGARAEGAPQSAAVARELLGIATDLFAAGAPGDIESLFDCALRRIEGAPDASLGVVLMIWFNLACLYDQHGAGELRQQTVNQIGHVATHYAGPIDRDCAEVFERMAGVAKASGNVDFMLTLYAQAHRYWSADPGVDPQQRADWCNRYLHAATGAGRDTEALAAEAAEAAAGAGAHRLRAEALLMLLRHQKARGDRAAARRTLEAALEALAAGHDTDSEVAAVVYQNLAGLQLQEPPGPGDARAAEWLDTTLRILTQRDLARGRDYAACLRERSLLAGRLGDWRTAARCQERAAAVANIEPAEITEALSHAGDAWYRLGAYEDAGRCYLHAVQRRGMADA